MADAQAKASCGIIILFHQLAKITLGFKLTVLTTHLCVCVSADFADDYIYMSQGERPGHVTPTCTSCGQEVSK